MKMQLHGSKLPLKLATCNYFPYTEYRFGFTFYGIISMVCLFGSGNTIKTAQQNSVNQFEKYSKNCTAKLAIS